MKKHFWKTTTVILMVIILCSGVATAVDGLWIPLYGGEVPSDAEMIVFHSSDNLFKAVPLSGDATIDNTGNLTLNPVLRYYPEIFACSMSGNTSTAWGSCESVDFGGIELHVIELDAGNNTGYFHMKTPDDFGFGGNTTVTVSYGIRTDGGSSGSSLIMSTLVGTSISDTLTEGWHNSTALAWTAQDEIYWTADKVIDESLGTGAQDLYFGVTCVSEDWDATAIYLDKVIFKGWGI